MILDGYTEHEALREADGEVSLSFRPMLLHERRYWKEVLLRAEAPERRLCGLLRSRIEWWDRGEVEDEAVAGIREAQPELFRRLWGTVFGVGNGAKERAEAKWLSESARRVVRHPHLWEGDACGHCMKWWYDPISNATQKYSDGSWVERGSLPYLCDSRGGCPRGHRTNQVVVPERHLLAYRHWREGFGRPLPDDGIVRRNARIFEQAWKTSGKKS